MSANIASNGKVRQLDRGPEPDERVTEEQAQDPSRLARVLMTILKDVASLKRRWMPRRLDFEDRVIAVSTTYRFTHNFNGAVRWWVVDWKPTSTAANQYAEFFRDASSDANTLVLLSSAVTAGTVTIRIEEAG